MAALKRERVTEPDDRVSKEERELGICTSFPWGNIVHPGYRKLGQAGGRDSSEQPARDRGGLVDLRENRGPGHGGAVCVSECGWVSVSVNVSRVRVGGCLRV